MEQEIIKFLVEKYNPIVIALVGSRAKGLNKETSDWDLYLFIDDKKRRLGEFVDYQGQLLDITFREWSEDETYVFNNPFGPAWPVKVLLDNSEGRFEKILENTKTSYDKGPLLAYPEGHAARLQHLNRWQQKMLAYQDNEIQFYYLCSLFPMLAQLWFEKHNMWPISPKPALDYIKEHDLEFWNDLSSLTTSVAKERMELVDRLVKKINSATE